MPNQIFKAVLLKSIKLKKLEELEKTGFTIQELKKLKMAFIEIAVEHNITGIEQVKTKFFELFEKLEDRIALESKNNTVMQLNLILENQIRTNRQTLHCQDEVGPILKNLFDMGIRESDIVAIKAIIDILLNSLGNNVDKLDERQEIINNLSSYSNLRLAKSKLKQEINSILNIESLENIQKHIDSLNKSFITIDNSENLNERKYLILCDSLS